MVAAYRGKKDMSSVVIRCYARFDDPVAYEGAVRQVELLAEGDFETLVEEIGQEAARLFEETAEEPEQLELSSGDILEELEYLYGDVFIEPDEPKLSLMLDVEGPGSLVPDALFHFLEWLGAVSIKGAAYDEQADETEYYLDGTWYDDADEVDWPDADWLDEEE